MNNTLNNLEPKLVWKHFLALCSLPHPSKHEEKVRNYIINFAKEHSILCHVDGVGNVILRKEATPGFENRKAIVMQGHMDMVPQKNNDKKFDFLTDPIEPMIDGEWVTANGTTLGADNGIGAAAALAIMEDNTISHGLIEALFTVDEETGLTGAFALESNTLKGDILLNLDSEDEGELYVGCAGGVDVKVHVPFTLEAVPSDFSAFKVTIKGMKGGHSGMEIILQRGNAQKPMSRFLRHAANTIGSRLVSINGGDVRNAIPREGSAIIVIPTTNSAALKQMVAEHEAIFKAELSATEPDLSFTVEEAATPTHSMDKASARRILNVIAATPNGVYRMSDSIKGLVETSCNLGVVKTLENKVEMISLVRSSVESSKQEVTEIIEAIAELSGSEFATVGGYPGWKPNLESPILKRAQEIYKNLYGTTPEIKAIHAGLECGIIGAKYPNMDMLSFGPTIRFPHSPDEKVNIATIEKFYKFLQEMIKNSPLK